MDGQDGNGRQGAQAGGEDGRGGEGRWVQLPSIRDRLWVSAARRPDGSLVIEGQDLDAERFTGIPGSEYEYGVVVPAGQVPLVVGALGGRDGDDVLDLLERYGEVVVRRGESSWLADLGIDGGLWSRVG